MIDYSVVVSEQAAKDLNGIFEYIAYELKSFQNAQGQLSRLEKGISSLGNMPERFRRYKREPWYSRGLRIMPWTTSVSSMFLDLDPPDCEQLFVCVRPGRDVDSVLEQYGEEG